MLQDSNQHGDQILLTLGGLTQSLSAKIGAVQTAQEATLASSNSSNNLLKCQTLSLPPTFPLQTAVTSLGQETAATPAPVAGLLKTVMSSKDLIGSVEFDQNQLKSPPTSSAAPFTLNSITSMNINNAFSSQYQNQTGLSQHSQQQQQPQQPNSMLYTYFNCKHNTVVTFQKCQYCKECGVRMYKNGQVLALKSGSMHYLVNTNPMRIYKNTYQKKKSLNVINLGNHEEYLKQRERVINFMTDLADRMRLSKQASFLSIMFIDYMVVNDKESELCAMKVIEHLQLYGGVCVMLAAKSVELDEKIPFLSTLKKYICLNQYSKEDLRKAEQKTVDLLGFRMQMPTLYDLLEFYGSQGVVFSNDMQKNTSIITLNMPTPFSSETAKSGSAKKEKYISNRTVEIEFQSTLTGQPIVQQDNTKNNSLNLNDCSTTQDTSSKNSNSDETNPSSCSPPSHKIAEAAPVIINDTEISPFKFYDIVQKIEKDLSRIAFQAIKNEKFYEQDLEILAAACICYLREKQNLSNPYRDEILQISNQDRALVISCSLIFLSKFDNYFKPPSYLTGTIGNSTSSGISPLKDIRTNIKNVFYTSDNYKSASSLTTSTRFLQENKRPLFDNIDLSSYRVRDKSFEKIGSSYQTTRNTLTTQQLLKQTSSGLSSTRTNLFDYSKPSTDQKLNNVSSISNISATSVTTSGLSTGISTTHQAGSITSSTTTTSTSSNISNLQSKLLQQQSAFSSGSYHSKDSASNILSSGISSINSSYQKPYQLALNQYSSKPLLSSGSTTSTSKFQTSVPNFDDEAKWNSHFTKSINSINYRANTFNSNSFLRRNKF